MKIFFAASIHGKKQNEAKYKKIVELVKAAGCQIQADHILGNTPEEMKKWQDAKDIGFHQWVLDEIVKSDVVFAELSYASTSVGFLVAHALHHGKPVVIFYSGDKEPHLFNTLEKTNDRLAVLRYQTLADLELELPQMLDFVSNSQDIRFNFFVTPKIVNYLNWIAKSKRIPRSVYLRRLIEKDKAQVEK